MPLIRRFRQTKKAPSVGPLSMHNAAALTAYAIQKGLIGN